MRMKEDAKNNGQTKPGSNVQILTENQYITNCGIYWRPTDRDTLIPFLESFKAKYGSLGVEIVADSGYGNEQNSAYLEGRGIDAYVKYNMSHAEAKGNTGTTPSFPGTGTTRRSETSMCTRWGKS